MQTEKFSRFSAHKNNRHFYHFSYKKKTACYQPRIRHANWIFFSSFLTIKRHAYFQHHSHINCMLFRQEFKSCKLKKFPGFQLRETICISTIFHTKKKCMLSTKNKTCKLDFFFFQFFNQKTTCIFPTSF